MTKAPDSGIRSLRGEPQAREPVAETGRDPVAPQHAAGRGGAKSLDELGSTLAFVRTSGTASGHVEVHLASGASGYQTRIRQLATTFTNETDGTWSVLVP